MVAVLSTKKLSKKYKIQLENAGFLVVEKNFITTKNIDFQINEIHKNLLFTSKNAIKSILKSNYNLKDKPVFCVGEKTKKFLIKKGFKVVHTEDYAEDLAKKIIADYPMESFTFFSGNLRRNTLPNAFLKNNIIFNEIKVYKTELNPHIIKKPVDVVLFFSPSGITSFLQKNTIENKKCICIGTTTAKALENKTKNILIADKPTIKKVIEKTITVFTENRELKT